MNRFIASVIFAVSLTACGFVTEDQLADLKAEIVKSDVLKQTCTCIGEFNIEQQFTRFMIRTYKLSDGAVISTCLVLDDGGQASNTFMLSADDAKTDFDSCGASWDFDFPTGGGLVFSSDTNTCASAHVKYVDSGSPLDSKIFPLACNVENN